VTELEIDDEDADLKKKWNDILKRKFKITSFLVEGGKDYVTSGNGFISLYIPFQRFLKCPDCAKTYPIETISYEFKSYKFQGSCPSCQHHVRYDVKDEVIKNIEKANLVRWSPENIDIEYNPITGEHRYKYSIPNEIRKLVMMGRRHIIEKLPMPFIDAIRDNLPIEFNPKNIFHLKRPSLAEKNQGWGEPAMIRNLKDLYYLQVLKKAREAIAQQHIVPLWVIFPQPQGELNPYEHLNLSEWRGRMEEEIKKWRQDPNYIPVLPIPVGFQFIGGSFKNLDTTPETQNLLLNILAGMNMPQEFVYGGLQYSGTSFSIRMLSNLFSSYRGQLLDFVNGFLIPNLSEIFSIKAVKTHFTDLKLADDIQKKQVLLQLNQLNKVSTGTVLAEMGLDATLEMKKIKDELKVQGEIMAAQMVEQEKAKADAMLQNIRGQIKSQLMQQKIAEEVQAELGVTVALEDPNKPIKINPALWQAIFGNNNGPQHQDDQGRPFFAVNPTSLPDTVKSLAKAIQGNNEVKRQEVLAELQNSMPLMHDLVQAELGTMSGQPAGGGAGGPLPRPGVDMRPMPAQKPPRRAGGA
jgi:hypothetical protein